MKKWKKEEEIKLIDLLENGNTYKQIGIILNRSYRSIKEKLNRLGFRQNDFNNVIFYENKKCLTCEKEFESLKSENRIYCSHSCSAIDTNHKKKKILNKKCKNCGIIFIRERENRIYCSHKCSCIFKTNEKSKDIEMGLVKSSTSLRSYLKRKDGCSCKICKMDRYTVSIRSYRWESI